MISGEELSHWRSVVPWSGVDQVAQDLVLARLVAEVANDPLLSQAVTLKGGTCLHKIWLDVPWRYSEDLDYQLTGPIDLRELFAVYRVIGERVGFSGAARKINSQFVHVLMTGSDHAGYPLRVKMDIQRAPRQLPGGTERPDFHVDSPWFQGGGPVPAFPPEEIIASKVIAVYQRKRPRDLFDMWAAIRSGLIETTDVATAYGTYRPLDPEHWTARQAARSLIERVTDHEYIADLTELARYAPVEYDLADNISVAVELIDQSAEATQTERSWKRVLRKGSTAQEVMAQWVDNNSLAAAEIGMVGDTLTRPVAVERDATGGDRPKRLLKSAIEAAHHADPRASHASIARQTGASHSYVSSVRRDLR